MKTLRILLPLLLLSLSASLFILYRMDLLRLSWYPRRSSFVYTELIESSESSLLQTAEYQLRLIFPYDFVEEGDSVDWSYLKRQYDFNPLEFRMKASSDFYPDSLPSRWKYASLYALCRESGIDPAGRGEGFIVISTRTKAGFRFNSDGVSFQEGETGEIEVMTLPGPEITAIIIEDRFPDNSNYPVVTMTPDQWSRFITELSDDIAAFAVAEGILLLAEETGALLLKELFKGGGIEIQTIDFRYERAE